MLTLVHQELRSIMVHFCNTGVYHNSFQHSCVSSWHTWGYTSGWSRSVMTTPLPKRTTLHPSSLSPSPTAPSSGVLYYSPMCQPGNAGLCTAFLILRLEQLTQPREDATSRATACSWNRLISSSTWEIPASPVGPGPSLCSAARGSWEGAAAASRETSALRLQHTCGPERKYPGWQAGSCPTTSSQLSIHLYSTEVLLPKEENGSENNTADEELLLPDPAPRLGRGHSTPCSGINAVIPKDQILFPWYGS